jgi:antibiotic biosynthesis monooxygenase (ABM) superfamily enzyme
MHNLTHFPGPLVCQIRQVLTSCTIRHISLVPWCVRLDRFWHHVQSDKFRTRKMCLIVHDVRTCLIWHTKGPGKCVWLYMMSIMYNLTHFPGPLVCQIRQVLTSCTIRHIFLVPWCVRLDRFWHHVQSDTFSIWHTKGPRKCVRLYMMSEPV